MPFLFRTLLLLVVAALCQQPVMAAPAMIPAPPQIAAKGYILVDASTGNVIVEKNADARLEPASLTKMMTSYVADYELRNGTIHRDDMALVSERAWAKKFQGSSLMFIEVGKQVAVSDLLKGVIISSGNDASVALAEHIAGSEEAFADLMNQQAARLGLKSTHFMNPHGLPDPEHYTTARDMATLARAIIRDFPEEYKLYSEKSYVYNNISQINRNRLLWRDPSVDGLKTGHTESAGYCLVASAVKNGTRLISVVLGTSGDEARMTETQKLFAYGFRFYSTIRAYAKNQKVQSVRIWSGEKETVDLVVSQDLFLTIPTARKGDIKADLSVDKYIEAPVKKGQPLGKIQLSLDDKVLANVPVVAAEAVEEGGFFSGMIDSIEMMMEKMMSD
jgi:D-alanyl-D-alanine carboxypeptidase (penicillin-binding protein 5/6)